MVTQELQRGEESSVAATAVVGLHLLERGRQGERAVTLAIGQAPGDQHVHRAGSQALGRAVGDRARAVGAFDQPGGVIGWVDQRDAQDAHERAVALAGRIGARLLHWPASTQTREGRAGGFADVELALAVWRIGAGIGPG